MVDQIWFKVFRDFAVQAWSAKLWLARGSPVSYPRPAAQSIQLQYIAGTRRFDCQVRAIIRMTHISGTEPSQQQNGIPFGPHAYHHSVLTRLDFDAVQEIMFVVLLHSLQAIPLLLSVHQKGQLLRVEIEAHGKW